MSTSIGHTFIYNLIILFIVIVFGFLAGALSYYKSYKVNNRIVGAIEQYEGYNVLSKAEIDRVLTTLSYSPIGNIGYTECPDSYKGMDLVEMTDNEFDYCVYIDPVVEQGKYYRYGVLTYMSIDLPVINNLRLKVFTRTNRIYKFTDTKLK